MSNNVKIPTRLFKYMAAKYVRPFCLGQSVHFGTLHDFRRQEAHSLQKADPMEGRILVGKPGPGRWHLDDPMHQNLKNTVAAQNLQTSGLGFQNGNAFGFECQNFHVLCTSTAMNNEIPANLDPKYDTCVEIINPKLFARRILSAYGRHFGLGSFNGEIGFVDYRPKHLLPTGHDFTNSSLFKEPDFQYQCEYRFSFLGTGVIPNPFDLRVNMLGVKTRISWRRPN